MFFSFLLLAIPLNAMDLPRRGGQRGCTDRFTLWIGSMFGRTMRGAMGEVDSEELRKMMTKVTQELVRENGEEFNRQLTDTARNVMEAAGGEFNEQIEIALKIRKGLNEQINV